MKTIYRLSLTLFSIIILVGCSDDDNMQQLTGEGIVKLSFDNAVGSDDLLLGSSSYTNSQNEVLTITRLNYIVSNFTLTNDMGEKYTFPKDDSYFITSEETGETEISLTNIPAGRYVSVTFGIGVDQEKYLQGAEGQGTFLAKAEAANMMWAWQAGYKFLNFEGTFTSQSVTEPTNFKVHMGSHGSSLDNYKEVTLDLGTEALVSDEMTPIIHLVADANAILDGTHKLSLSEQAVIMVSEEKSPKVASNVLGMFSVDHVHNGSGDTH
jgi:hypothetical protein